MSGAFIKARKVDANHSNITYVAGNNFTIYGCPHASEQTSPVIQEVLNYLEDLPSPSGRLAPDPAIPIPLSPPHTSTSHSPDTLELAIGLINDIRVLLKGCPERHRDLMHELLLLKQMLVLTKLTLARYAHTPLAEALARTVNAEVDRCHSLLQGILNSLNGYRHILSSIIGFLWRAVWWAGWEADELKSLRMKLAASRISLYKFLEAMHSYVLHLFSVVRHLPPSLEFPGSGSEIIYEIFFCGSNNSTPIRVIRL